MTLQLETSSPAFGALLKRYRTRAGISQELLAEQAELSVETISSLERGVRRNPYRATVELLATALGLTAAERDILAAAALRPETCREPAAVRSSLRPPNGPNGNLPLQLTSFVGHTVEVAAIRASLKAHRLVTLTGTGGVGKTRVALEVAALVADDMLDSAWLVEFGTVTDPALIAHTIAGALRSRLRSGENAVAALAALLSEKALLLVLDNCEHVLSAIRDVAARLLLACPNVTLLATSRQPMGIAGEVTFPVPTLRDFEAIALFSDRARAVVPTFELDDRIRPIAADICRRLDGIPLAIELAASRMKILSLTDLRERLDDRFRILTGGSCQALPRQQTLRALIEWSYNLLGECERQLFRRVAVFADGFTLEAANAICGDERCDELDVLDLLAGLVDKSLVLAAVVGDSMRYRLLESTRMYALEMLVVSGERDAIDAQHLEFFSALAVEAERAFQRTGSDAPFTALAPDIDNIRAALHHSLGTGNATLAVATARLFQRLGLAGEAIEWLEAALESVGPVNVRMRSRIYAAIGYLLGNTGGTQALDACDRAVALARSAHDSELLGWTLTQLAVAAMDKRRRSDAEAALVEAEALFGPDPQPHQRARILAVRLHIVRLAGEMEAALEISKELSALYRRLGNLSGELRAALNYAESLHACGDTSEAIGVVRATLQRAGDDREAEGSLLLNLTAYYAAVGDAVAAVTTGTQAIEVFVPAGPASGSVATSIGHTALAHALNGDVRRAAILAAYWKDVSQRLGIVREFTERVTHEKLSALFASQLAPAELANLTTMGAALEPREAIAMALAR